MKIFIFSLVKNKLDVSLKQKYKKVGNVSKTIKNIK